MFAEENRVSVDSKIADGQNGNKTFQAGMIIAQNWQSLTPPVPEEWVKAMDATVWREKVVFIRRRNLDKFLKMWKPWLDKMGCPP